MLNIKYCTEQRGGISLPSGSLNSKCCWLRAAARVRSSGSRGPLKLPYKMCLFMCMQRGPDPVISTESHKFSSPSLGVLWELVCMVDKLCLILIFLLTLRLDHRLPLLLLAGHFSVLSKQLSQI